MQHQLACKQCNGTFTVRPYRAETAKYCSRRCQALHTRVLHGTNCATCGEYFARITGRPNKAKYCSRKCYHKAMNTKGTVTYSCRHCSAEFLDAPSHKRAFCSRKCNQEHRLKTWNPSFIWIRKAMWARGLITECERCGYDTEPLILGIHHRDRNRKNNKPDNLEVLCPTCHSLEHLHHVTSTRKGEYTRPPPPVDSLCKSLV